MNDTERIDWLIRVNAHIWNKDKKGGRFTVCVPEDKYEVGYAVEVGDSNLRVAIDAAYKKTIR